MNDSAGRADAATMPTGEALVYAERFIAEGRLQEAESVCRKALEARPNCPEAEHLLGVIAHQNGKLGDAVEHLRRAAELAPRTALFHANLGEMYRIAGRLTLAVEEARRALDIEPAMPTALSNLGCVLYDLKDYEGAARAQREAVDAAPDFAQAYSNLGNALHALRRSDEAIAAHRRALDLQPDYANAWANLGTTLAQIGRLEEGASALRHAVALAPHHANAHTGLGIVLLMRGDLAEGWDEYEWRLLSTEQRGARLPERPWQGERLAGRHIYVQAEQGLGDTLQFARYVPHLAARAGAVTFRVQQQLAPLMRENLPGVTVLGDRGDPAPYQCDAALISLPRLFRTRLETIPAHAPYLRTPADVALRWKRRLNGMAGVRVGVVWAGNPGHVNDHRRSIAAGLMAPLCAVSGASFVSLQFGPPAADLKELHERDIAIDDLSAELGEFVDTAGAVCALDLLVTVDTSVAHLAGALGKPVWVLLPWLADWRWLLNREDSPWYPTMRLFRQKQGEDWGPVIARVARELEAVARGDPRPLTPFKTEGERRAAEAAAIIAAEAAQAATQGAAAPRLWPSSAGQALVLAEQKAPAWLSR